jgi:uncharacterized small protein (DUF1192 family)
MDWDDLDPKANKPKPKDLEVMGVEQLNDYIAELETEIARAREAIASKTSARSAADTFFRKP